MCVLSSLLFAAPTFLRVFEEQLPLPPASPCHPNSPDLPDPLTPTPTHLHPTHCSKGATLGCFKRTCRASYHLACARKYNCLLQVGGLGWAGLGWTGLGWRVHAPVPSLACARKHGLPAAFDVCCAVSKAATLLRGGNPLPSGIVQSKRNCNACLYMLPCWPWQMEPGPSRF